MNEQVKQILMNWDPYNTSVEEPVKQICDLFKPDEPNQCDHDFVSAVNEVIKSGYVCPKCGALSIDGMNPIEPDESLLLSDEECKEEFNKYFTDEQMELPEPYFTTVTGIIAIIRKAQLAKAEPLIRAECQARVERIFKEIEETGVLRRHSYVVEGTSRQDEEHYPERCGRCKYENLKQREGIE